MSVRDMERRGGWVCLTYDDHPPPTLGRSGRWPRQATPAAGVRARTSKGRSGPLGGGPGLATGATSQTRVLANPLSAEGVKPPMLGTRIAARRLHRREPHSKQSMSLLGHRRLVRLGVHVIGVPPNSVGRLHLVKL